jgi:hypothetical protein
MALAEALKSNTTLKELTSAALPSNPPADALRPHEHARSLHWPSSLVPSPFVQPPIQQPRPRGWHGARRGPQEQHHPRKAGVCCPAIKPTCPCATVFPSPPRFRASHALPRSLEASQHLPRARALHATSHSLRVSRTSPARAQPTHSLHTHAEQVACLPPHRCHPRPRTPRGPRPRPPLPTGGWRARAHPPACNLPVAGCRVTTSAPTPSRPSQRPPATASSWSSSKPAGSGLQLHVLYLQQAATVRDTTGLRRRGVFPHLTAYVSPFSGRPFNV